MGRALCCFVGGMQQQIPPCAVAFAPASVGMTTRPDEISVSAKSCQEGEMARIGLTCRKQSKYKVVVCDAWTPSSLIF